MSRDLVRVDPNEALQLRMEHLAIASESVLLSRDVITWVAIRAADVNATPEAVRDGVLAFLLCAGESPSAVARMQLYGYAVPGMVPVVASVSLLLGRWQAIRGSWQGPYILPVSRRTGRLMRREIDPREILRILAGWKRASHTAPR